MRLGAPLAVAALLLVGCGATAPTPTPDPRSPSGYRRAAHDQANAIAIAVTVAYATCTRDPGQPCAEVLTRQRALAAPPVRWLRATPPPPTCAALFAGYLDVAAHADAFYDDGLTAASGGDPAVTQRVLVELYGRFTDRKSAVRGPRQGDGCTEQGLAWPFATAAIVPPSACVTIPASEPGWM